MKPRGKHNNARTLLWCPRGRRGKEETCPTCLARYNVRFNISPPSPSTVNRTNNLKKVTRYQPSTKKHEMLQLKCSPFQFTNIHNWTIIHRHGHKHGLYKRRTYNPPVICLTSLSREITANIRFVLEVSTN